MERATWVDGLIPKSIIPDDLEGKLEDEVWGEETSLIVIPSDIGINIFKNIVSHLPLDIVFDENNLTTHYIEYNIKKSYEITKHKDYCDITVLVYLDKDEDIKDTFYVCDKKCRKEKWDIQENSYAVLAFNGWDDHWGNLKGTGFRSIMAFHYSL